MDTSHVQWDADLSTFHSVCQQLDLLHTKSGKPDWWQEIKHLPHFQSDAGVLPSNDRHKSKPLAQRGKRHVAFSFSAFFHYFLRGRVTMPRCRTAAYIAPVVMGVLLTYRNKVPGRFCPDRPFCGPFQSIPITSRSPITWAYFYW